MLPPSILYVKIFANLRLSPYINIVKKSYRVPKSLDFPTLFDTPYIF